MTEEDRLYNEIQSMKQSVQQYHIDMNKKMDIFNKEIVDIRIFMASTQVKTDNNIKEIDNLRKDQSFGLKISMIVSVVAVLIIGGVLKLAGVI